MKTKPALSPLMNERGIAMVETVPLLVVFIMLIGFALGIFGVIHTAILHSIAARTYSYETFRNRTDLKYFREDGSGTTRPLAYVKKGWRYHGVQYEGDSRTKFVATSRPISYGRSTASSDASAEAHNSEIYQMKDRNEKTSVSPAWVMVGYGICITAKCGD